MRHFIKKKKKGHPSSTRFLSFPSPFSFPEDKFSLWVSPSPGSPHLGAHSKGKSRAMVQSPELGRHMFTQRQKRTRCGMANRQ